MIMNLNTESVHLKALFYVNVKHVGVVTMEGHIIFNENMVMQSCNAPVIL